MAVPGLQRQAVVQEALELRLGAASRPASAFGPLKPKTKSGTPSLNYREASWLPPYTLYLNSVAPGIREGNGSPVQYSCLENPMDGRAWWAAVHGVAKSRTQLSDFTFPFHFHALEKDMATHSSVLAWRTPGTAEPGGLPSMGSHRVEHD